MNEIKLKKLLQVLYSQEILGKNVYEVLGQYPQLDAECDKLIEVAYIYEVAAINKTNNLELKNVVTQQILVVHNLATTIPEYKRSELYFDDSGNLTGLF